MGAVYKLTSPSGKHYIGKTKGSLEIRWGQHKTLWKKLKEKGDYTGATPNLFYAFDKYGTDNWVKEILFESDNVEELNNKEIELIEQFDTIKNGYNVTKGGDGRIVDNLEEEHKRNIGEARKKWFQSPDGLKWKGQLSEKFTGDNNPSFNKRGKPGRVQPEEERQQRSENIKRLHAEGHYKDTCFKYERTEEHRRNSSERMKQRHAEGKYDEARKKTSKTLMGHEVTKEHRLKTRKSLSHKHLITFTDGTQEEIAGFKEYSEKSNIPFDTIRLCYYRKTGSPKWRIQSVIKLD